MCSLSFKGETFAQQKADRSSTALQIPSTNHYTGLRNHETGAKPFNS